MNSGYYRYPSLHENSLVFVCEDDLWSVPVEGGVARRLTSGLAEATHPVISPDGRLVAFTGREEGQSEVYVMPATGGSAKRLTFMGGHCWTVGWSPEGQIVFANSAGQPFGFMHYLYTVNPAGGMPEVLNIGPARAITYGPNGSLVIGRNIQDPARWKRYRGGTAGQLWIDRQGTGEFSPLIDLAGNLASPMWLGERIFFLADHEGIGNIYSCLADGEDLRRHSDHHDYYARNATSDGRRIVYHAGADLYLLDPEEDMPTRIEVTYYGSQTQRNRRFVDAASYLDSWSLHPEGHSLAITSRGKAFSFGNWEGAVLQHGQAIEPRYRLLDWLNDGERMVAVTDAEGEEAFVILTADSSREPELLADLDIGRPMDLAVNPRRDELLFSNHRYELCWLDINSKELKIIDRGRARPIDGFAWSPDGRWAAYSVSLSLKVSAIYLWQAESGETIQVSEPVLRDYQPAFDPKGRFLYFLSQRTFDPVYDNLSFNLSFPRGVRPYLITLQADAPSPFVPLPRAPGDKSDEKKSKSVRPIDSQLMEVDESQAENESDQPEGDGQPEAADQPTQPEGEMQIDLAGIERRILPFPVNEALYGRIMGSAEGKVLYSRFPVSGALNSDWLPSTPKASGSIFGYDFEEQKEEPLISQVSDFALSRNARTLVYRSGDSLRVLKAGSKPNDNGSGRAGRESGWVDLSRVKVSIDPAAEWRQMYQEAWRLQRDQFWTPDMSQVDWRSIYQRYLPLLERVSSRAEFSDLIMEMQGELGTSHAYIYGGDYRPEPKYWQGFLGAAYRFDEPTDSWWIDEIVMGDGWDEQADSPLNQLAAQVKVGDRLVAINGRKLDKNFSPAEALVNQAGQYVNLLIADQADGAQRLVTVKALFSESAARYRQWVYEKRRYVHETTSGRVGYVHIPDMMARGFAEFHRAYLAEAERDGLIVDVRYNGGGHISQLILEKLARKRLAYDVPRWGQELGPYPAESVRGPLVALINEYAGSDGDIFSQGFRLMGLGPLIGKRTWGGVVGINPRHRLVDGTVTTQPEFSFWFKEVGFGVENYGVEPDIEVDNRPQDYAAGIDVQLDRAIKEILELLETYPPEEPSLEERPNLALPKLPPRA